MKKFKFFAVTAMLVWSLFAQAQPRLVVKTPGGEYETEDINTGIFAEVGAEKYNRSFSQAIKEPGKKILVKTKKPVLKIKINFQKTVEIRRTYIIFKPINLAGEMPSGKIFLVEERDVADEPAFLMYFGVALIFLLLLNTLIKKFSQADDEFRSLIVSIFFILICIVMIVDLARHYDYFFSILSLFPVAFFGVFFIYVNPSDPDLEELNRRAREKNNQYYNDWPENLKKAEKILGFLAFAFIIWYFFFLLLGK